MQTGKNLYGGFKMAIRRSMCHQRICYNLSVMTVKKSKKKPEPRAIFDSIRKPIAPPSRTIGKQKPEERIHPSERKVKYKKKPETED